MKRFEGLPATLSRLRRPVSAAGFGLSLVVFLLPLATASSCGEQVEVSGITVQVIAAAALVSGQLTDLTAWPFVVLGVIPLISLIGLAVQLLHGRTGGAVTLALSVTGLAALISSGVSLLIGGSWRWLPAFYVLCASFLPAALCSSAEIAQRGRSTSMLPARSSATSHLIPYVGIATIVAVVGAVYYAELTGPGRSNESVSEQLSNDTWTWAGTGWHQESPKQRPPARDSGNLTYDQGRHRVILYGGIDHRDTWSWNGTNWTEKHPATVPDSSIGVTVYDNRLGEIVFIDRSARLWGLDDRGWQEIATTNGPKTIAYTGSAGTTVYAGYDQKRAELVVLTNTWRTADNTSRYETWTWNGADWRLAAAAAVGWFSGPDPAGTPRLVYDPDRDVLLSIGRTSIWTWNGAAWTSINKPFAGSGAGVYDSNRHLLVYLQRGTPAVTWLWDGTTWSNPNLSIPWTAQDVAIAFDSSRDTVVVFG